MTTRMSNPPPAGGENMSIASSTFLLHTKEAALSNTELQQGMEKVDGRLPANVETQKMNLCQAVNNAMDLALERDEKAGT